MKKFYLTTPIYYINDKPHIGHTYTTVAADILARYHKLSGEKTYFLTGTDEHGAKAVEAAEIAKKSPQAYADEIASEFKKAWQILNIDYDRFIRTTDPDHIKTVEDFLQKLYDKGWLYKKTYQGLYCVGCEKFLTKDELVDGKCPDHNREPVCHQEENWFFKLSAFESQLQKIIESDQYQIRPIERKNEVLGKIKIGLEDVSISRTTLKWGIPLPFDKGQTCYVWVDALLNYYTFGKLKKIWPADLHITAKDILWFHGIVWPALLLATSEKIPLKYFVHGFFTIEGKKMSKSLGNVITPYQLVEKFGIDGTRYLLVSTYPFGSDGDISWERFQEKYNADLANGLGNLVARVAKLAEKAEVKSPKKKAGTFDSNVKKALSNIALDQALFEIWKLIQKENNWIDQQKPWQQKGKSLEKTLTHSIEGLYQIAYNLQPFLPKTSQKILNQFSGPKIKAGPSLFPRLR